MFTWIRILGSMPDADMDPDPSILIINLQDANNKNCFLTSFSAYYILLEGTFTSFFKDKKSKRIHKTVGTRN